MQNTENRGRDDVFTDPRGMKRRTILAGAAWTIPVVVTATAAPAFAASSDLTLKFDKSSYSGQACGTISGAYVTATRNGAAASGESVTISLADGYTFDGNATSSTGSTGSDGRYAIPDIHVPAGGGNSTFTATSGQASATASVSADSTTKAYDYQSSINRTDQSTNVPSGSTARGWTVYLAENGDLYDKNTKIASGVKTAVGQINPNGNGHLVSYTTSSGAFSYQSDGNATTQDTNVPTGATAVGWTAFLAQNGDLYDRNTKIATGVKTAVGQINPANNGHLVAYTTSSGAYTYQSNGDGNGGPVTTHNANVPAGATVVGWTGFLAQNGDLYDDDTKIATGVKTAVGQINPANNGHLIAYTTSSGAYGYQSNGDGNGGPVTTQNTNVPAGSTAVGWTDFLAENGDLYDGNSKIASNVKTAVGAIDPSNNGHLVSYTSAPSC